MSTKSNNNYEKCQTQELFVKGRIFSRQSIFFVKFFSESENESLATQEKQIARELKLLTTKLKTFKEKQAATLKERRILREQMKKRQKELKDEKQKYKVLQKEVDKMASLMKETEDEHEDDETTEEEEEVRETILCNSDLKSYFKIL